MQQNIKKSLVVNTTSSTFIKHNWPGISWALFIFILSSISPPSFKIPDLFDLFAPDKVVHFFFYAILVILLTRGFRQMPPGRIVRNQFSIAFFSSAIFGGLIELYQGFFLSDRTGDWVDFLANCVGATIGWLSFKLYDSLFNK